MTAGTWRWMRLGGGAAILLALVRAVGTGPFLEGVRTVDRRSLAVAAGIAVVTTLCCAWRWSLVARGFGVHVPLRAAFGAYYRSQFLNSTLPGGVLGDVHRAVRHGRSVGDIGASSRSVVAERVAGQAVTLAMAAAVLVWLPAAPPSVVAAFAICAALAVGGMLAALRRRPAHRSSWVWAGVALASAVVAVGHAATFLVAVAATGATTSPARVLPVAVVVLAASAVPVNLAGWGPREGAAAWAFGWAGLSATQGVTAAVTYGVLALVATVPGALLLLRDWRAGVG